MKVKRLAELGLLTALALIIFVVELQIPNPVPIPGVKLGLANIIYGICRVSLSGKRSFFSGRVPDSVRAFFRRKYDGLFV